MAVKKAENDLNRIKSLKIEMVSDDDAPDFPADHTHDEPIDAEVLEEMKAEIIEHDETTEKLTGIAALLANVKTEKEVSLIIKRLPDAQYKGQFRVPCSVISTIETVIWNGESYPGEHYDYVQKTYGGGFYRFQLHYDGGFKEAWKETLYDLATLSEKEKLIKKEEETTSEQVRTAQSSQQFAQQPQASATPENKLDGMREMMTFYKEMKEFETTFAPKDEEKDDPAPEPVTKESIQMEIVKDLKNDPEIMRTVVRSIFGVKEQQEKPAGFFVNLGNSVGAAIVSNPRIIERAVDAAATTISAVADIGKGFFNPKPKRPAGGLDALSPMPDTPTPDPAAETPPQPAQTAADNPPERAPAPEIVLEIKPSIRI